MKTFYMWIIEDLVPCILQVGSFLIRHPHKRLLKFKNYSYMSTNFDCSIRPIN